MNNYINELKDTSYRFGWNIYDICQRSRGRESKIYPFLNYVAMVILESKGHKRSKDYDECKRKGMEFLIENVNCVIEKDIFESCSERKVFYAYTITYEKDEGETMPFSRMKMMGMRAKIDMQFKGLSSHFFASAPHELTDTIHNGFQYDEYAYTLMESINLTSKYYVAGMIKDYGKCISMLPTPRELGRAIKETPRLSTFSTDPLSMEGLRLKLLSSSVGDGEYVYKGVRHNRQSAECERTTVHFIKKDNTLLMINSSPNHMSITRGDLPYPIFFAAHRAMEDIHGEDMATAVKTYEHEASAHQALLETMTSQHKRTLELLNDT